MAMSMYALWLLTPLAGRICSAMTTREGRSRSMAAARFFRMVTEGSLDQSWRIRRRLFRKEIMRHLHHPIKFLHISHDPLQVLQHHRPLDTPTQLTDLPARMARATADVNDQRRLLVAPRSLQPLGKRIQPNSPGTIEALRLHGIVAIGLPLREPRDMAPAVSPLGPPPVCAYTSSPTSTSGPAPGVVALRISRTRSSFSTTTSLSGSSPTGASRDSRTSALMGVPSAGSAPKTPISRRHLSAVARHSDPRRSNMTPAGPWTSASSFLTSTARDSWAAASWVALLLLLLLAPSSSLSLEVSA
ncbi:hypothetical protein VMCG_02695 [Cytospora schulzeri]|uniref:Uncharacterized protein n=1 Tax=Cytospora schulzeri TaxID=448051 RepID=A0A423WZ97_9PEZI|nr:hypothetical protein VMCG_02695 [Valsa malicola]